MKKIILLMITILIFSVSCSKKNTYSLENLPRNYAFENAKRDGCVVYEDGDVTSGKEIFFAFADKSSKGKKCSVRLAFYYTLKESHVSKEYYNANKDNYPKLFIMDLNYDGEKYALRQYKNGIETVKSYKYMKCLPFYPVNIEADYKSIKHYVLLNDDNIDNYNTIWQSIASSRLGDYIDSFTVYSEFIR